MSYVKEAFDKVKLRDPDQPEFHQAVWEVLETLELIERKWKIEDKIMRPEFQMLGHTGFLTFCRKF